MSLSVTELADDFIADCEHRGLSPRTIKVYRSATSLYIASQGNDLASLTKPTVRRWLAEMRHLKANTINSRLAGITAFGSFLRDERVLPETPSPGCAAPRSLMSRWTRLRLRTSPP
jgi:site-specific recombinase XerD